MRSRIFVVMAVILLGSLGCENRPVALNESAEGQIQDDLQAHEILATVLHQYQSAISYQDKAVMYLSYRLDGRAIQEPHPWSVAWDRHGRYSADLFNAKIRCDSKQLSCYVFDIETGNIDNQHLLVEANQFGVLLNDPIASHFIFGTSELPLFEEEAKHRNRLVPPMIGFADSQLLPTWFAQAEQVRRLSDDDSTGSKCYVLELVEANRIYRLWIDQGSGMIEQFQLPLEYLDSQILASEQVSDLRFFVRFHDAVMNAQIEPEHFAIKKRLASKMVERFVTLPEPMPSERIGQKIESWELLNTEGKPYKASATAKSLTLVWLVGGVAEDIVEELREVKPAIRKNIVVVYSDDLVEGDSGSVRMLESDLRELLDEAELRFLYDPQMKTSSQFKLKSVPAFVVLDGAGRMQFAKAIDSTAWANELSVAVKRVESGENLAAEIRQEYQEFLDSYHLQIAQNATSESRGVDISFDRPNEGRLEQIANQMWESTALKNPGNILVQNGRTFVFDGWQTIVELNASGEIVGSQRLSIPDETAVNRLRSIDIDGKVYFAAFGMLGRNVFVFDESWKLIRQFPNAGELDAGIQLGVTDCQFAIESGEVELWITSMTDGLFRLSLGRDEVEEIPAESAQGFCRLNGETFRIVESKLELNGIAVEALIGWRVNAVGALRRGCVVTASNAAGSWQIFMLDDRGELLWKDAISPQYLENEVQPLVVNEIGGIALGNDGMLTIFSDEGILRKVRLAGELSGIALDPDVGAVLISNGQNLSSWKLRDSTIQVLPASTQLKTRK